MNNTKASHRSRINVEHLTLQLVVTERCNLKCSYCYQVARRNSRKGILALETAKNAIAKHLTNNDDFKKVIIELIGGEVLLYYSFVQDLITWTVERINDWKKEFVFFIDTNGTLLTDAMKRWFYENRHHVVVGLSLDGTPEAHNINRSNSYSRIEPHFPFFAHTWPESPVKMTISPQTVPMIFDSIIHIYNQGLKVAANVPMENIWGTPEEKQKYISRFKREILRLVNFFRKFPELPLPSIIDLPIYSITSEEDRKKSWCGSGRNMVAYDVDGKELPCNRYAAMSFNHELFDIPLTEGVSQCDYCLFKPTCQSCEAHNWEVNGNPNIRTSFHCEFSKLQIWGTAQIQLDRIIRRISEIRKKKKVDQAELAVLHEHTKTIELILTEFEKQDDLLLVGMSNSVQ